MTTASQHERACPHCTGPLASPGIGSPDSTLTSSVSHAEDCPMQLRAKRIGRLAAGFLGASLYALSVPGCQARAPEVPDAFGLDNGTVGSTDCGQDPGKSAA